MNPENEIVRMHLVSDFFKLKPKTPVKSDVLVSKIKPILGWKINKTKRWAVGYVFGGASLLAAYALVNPYPSEKNVVSRMDILLP
jgi:hypothetical protein